MQQMKECDCSKIPRMDAFYYLAWEGTFGAEKRNAVDVQIRNIGYIIDAVQLAERMGCGTFVGVGSQAEYGRVEGLISADTPCRPENGYGMAKLCAGQMSRLACSKLGIRHEWARIFSVYGSCDGADTMVSYAVRACLKGESPRFTKGEQMWDYLYGRDAGEALYLIGERGIDGKVYPVGSGEAHPLSEYIRTICKYANPDITPQLGAVPYADRQVMHLQADISELQADTGFRPQISFAEGITRTIAWERENRHV
jgi:nucleoside-diphosphate-sugar epimerase